jgi:carbon monoxide dehydrogenase subunit G
MSLTINETFRVNAPVDRVWRFLLTPPEVVTCLPGAEITEAIDERTYAGRVKVKVGPVTAAYTGRANLTVTNEAAREMQLVGNGTESGGAGSARMTMSGSVIELPDGASEVRVSAVIDIAGKVMQFGRGLIESVSRQLFAQFATAVRQRLESETGASPPSSGPMPTAVSSDAPSNAPADVGTAAPLAPPPSVRPTPTELRFFPLLWRAILDLFRRRRRRA